MTPKDAADYIRNDIRKSVIDDVRPCLNLDRPEGGYFGVPRLVLAYVDYLGVLYHGYDGSVDRSGRRAFSKTAYAKNFLVEVFGAVHDDYRRYGELLYEMYRHGTIHLYEPLTFNNSRTGKTIEWRVFKQAKESTSPTRVGEIATKPWNLMLLHLVPTPKPGQTDRNVWVLPVSINCLYFDLLEALEIYAQRLEKEADLADRFQKAINALLTPEQSDLEWP